MAALNELNFRDVGGVPVKGGVMRRGHLYRSEGPANFEAGHIAELGEIGFRVVCDLRTAHEQEAAPNDWAAAARLLNFDILADLRAKNDAAWSVIHANPTREGARQTMINTYRAIPPALLPHFPHLIDALSRGETPVLVHCTAGKDRTGVMVALLLDWLGATPDDIRRDYLRSEIYTRRVGNDDKIRDRFRQTIGYFPDDEVLMALLGVDTDYLDAAFETVNATWGSVERYFAAAGLDESAHRDMCTALVGNAEA